MSSGSPPSAPGRRARARVGGARRSPARGHGGADRQPASERILRAATELFKIRGYHGTTVRELAQAVSIEAASLYYHFPSKQEILFALFNLIMDDLLAGLDRAIAGRSGAEEQLRAVVRFHVLFHIARQDEAFISHSELRSLTAHNREHIIGKRDRYERKFRKLLSAGVSEGVFEIEDIPLTSTALLMMCSGVSDWFEGQGRLAPDTVADRYADMVIRLVAR